jgi:hypothetical protein
MRPAGAQFSQFLLQRRNTLRHTFTGLFFDFIQHNTCL